jgi:uncharacterized protein (DUF934 family)
MLISAISEPSIGGAPAQVATEDLTHCAPRVFKHHRVVEDSFTYIADDAIAGSGNVIVSLKRFHAEKDILLARNTPIGVRLETAQSPELLAGDISRLSLIEIHTPYFKDGRAFSWARLLRTRLGFKGEIRLTGHFLMDQIAFFMRVGVDSFTLPENLSAADVEKAVGQISNVYQPSSDHRLTIRDLRRGTVLPAGFVSAP